MPNEKMVEIAIVNCEHHWCGDEGYEEIIRSISDWETITEEEFDYLRKNIHRTTNHRTYYRLIQRVPVADVFKSVNDALEKLKKQEEAEKKRRAEAAAKRKESTEKRKRAQLEKLKRELGEE